MREFFYLYQSSSSYSFLRILKVLLGFFSVLILEKYQKKAINMKRKKNNMIVELIF